MTTTERNPEMPIALAIGKRYVTKDGTVTGPLILDFRYPEPLFLDPKNPSDIRWDASGGTHYHQISGPGNDIVAEWVETDTQPTIPPQVGKTYRMRNGDTVGPMRFRGNGEDWPFLGYVDTGVARLYQPDGRHHANPAWDIISEITPDADAPTAEGPVRRRTVTEIVPGAYGRVEVNRPWKHDAPNECVINLLDRKGRALDRGNFTATELRAAAAVLIALADGLDEMAAK